MRFTVNAETLNTNQLMPRESEKKTEQNRREKNKSKQNKQIHWSAVPRISKGTEYEKRFECIRTQYAL